MQPVHFNRENPIHWFQKGEERGFNFIFKEFYTALCIYSFCITKDQPSAEEIASSSFIKIWERHERFNDLQSVRAYLYAIVHNDSLKLLRSKNRRHISYGNLVYLLRNARETEHVRYLIKAELVREMYGVISELPASCRKIFTMLYIDGKSVQETAKELNLSPSTIKTQKQRGLAVLRKKLSRP